jgi:predicted ATPase with chaperone activity
MALSPRVMHRIMKVARTLADMDAAGNMAIDDLAEAIANRPEFTGDSDL